jgi:hypothetical protein
MMPDSAHLWSVVALVETPAAWFLALLLGVAAAHKLLWRRRALTAVSGLTGLSSWPAGLALGAALGVEMLAAIALLLPDYRTQGALLAALLWSLYLASMVRTLLSRRGAVDCGCSFGKAHRPLGRFQMLRTAALAALAFAIGMQPAGLIAEAGNVSLPALLLTQALCACALLALYAALDAVMSLDALRPGVLR